MGPDILSSEAIQDLRVRGIISESEVAFFQGDLLVVMNVITNERRVIKDAGITEGKAGKRLLKG
jgi:hypothetical protein